MSLILVLLLVVLGSLPEAEAHCRLIRPPGRSSMFRFGFSTPANYDDNQLNCGGKSNQWDVHNGKCGLCGDPWQHAEPRANERGGKYGKGPTVATYTEGQTIEIEAHMTANHKGWFEVKVCATNDRDKRATQACLDQHVLRLHGSSSTHYYVPDGNIIMSYRVQLPVGLACSWCVLQWRYHAGNSWGVFANGTDCVGCGEEQEEFYGCADVVINPLAGGTYPPIQPPPSTPAPSPKTTTKAPQSGGDGGGSDSTCCGVPPYDNPSMDKWCQINCALGFCPETHCKCKGC